MAKFLRKTSILFLAVFTFVMFSTLPLLAGTYGKIAGTVKDADTGEALPGADVTIVGTTMGASADTEGRYFIINVPVGTYSLKASFMGYVIVTKTDVKVSVDVTTEVNFDLKTTVIEGEAVTVVAERPLIEKTLTATKATVGVEELDNTLPVAGVNDIVETTASTFKGYIRGGRKYETKYIIDGVDVTDPFFSAGTGVYGGAVGHNYHGDRQSEARETSSVDAISSSVQELNVFAGTFNAEYPTAAAGIVNIVTKEGGAKWHGKLFTRSTATDGLKHNGTNLYRDRYDDNVGELGDPNYRRQDGYFKEKAAFEAQGTDEALRRARLYTWTEELCKDKYFYDPVEGKGLGYSYEVEGNLSGPLTNKGGFFLSGRYSDYKSGLPFERTRLLNANLKLHYNLTPTARLTGYFQLEDGGDLFGWVNWKFLPKLKYYMEGAPRYKSLGMMGYLKWTHTLSPKTYYEIQISQNNKKNLSGYPDDDGDGWCEIDESGDFIDFDTLEEYIKYVGGNGDPDSENGYVYGDTTYTKRVFFYSETDPKLIENKMLFSGYEGMYRSAYPAVFYGKWIRNVTTIKGDITSQITYNHQLKAGAQFRYHTVDVHTKYSPLGGAGYEYPTSKFWLNEWKFHPLELACYAQDRIEYSGMIINVGARVDGFKTDANTFANDYQPFEEIKDEEGNFLRWEPLRGDKLEWKWHLSPRVGVSHPVTDRLAMHYSWGKFFQYPNFASLYKDYDFTMYAASPNLETVRIGQEPTTATAYEMGAQFALTNEFTINVTGFYRDVDNYSHRNFVLKTRPGRGLTIATTWGYADSRGIEVTLERRPAKWVHGRITYAYTYIKEAVGVGGTAEDQRISYDTKKDSLKFGGELPWEILDAYNYYESYVTVRTGGGGSVLSGGYDRPHRITASLIFPLPYGVNISTVTTASSGFHYHTIDNPKKDPYFDRRRTLETGPWNWVTNLRITWEPTAVVSLGGINARLFYEVRNLFDRENIISYAWRGFTGGSLDQIVWERSMREGDPNPEGHIQSPVDEFGRLFYDIARQQYVGLEIFF